MHAVWTGARFSQAVLLVIVAVFAAPLVSNSVAMAALVQDDEDEADTNAEGTEGADANAEIVTLSSTLSVSIVAGACDTPDANTPTFELPDAAPVGVSAAGETYTSEGDISVPLGDLLAVPQVFALGMDDVDLDIPIACTAIDGTVAGGKLIIGLLAVDGGDLIGIAVLSETGGGTATHVETYVVLSSDAGGDVGSEDGDDEEDTVDGEGGV